MTMTPNTKVQLVELPLGEAGLDYVRSALQGDTTFSQEMLRAGFAKGCASALVPVGILLPRALAFDQGGLVSPRAAEDWLVQHVVSLCRSSPDSVVLFEDKWGGRKGEEAVMAGNETKFFHDRFGESNA